MSENEQSLRERVARDMHMVAGGNLRWTLYLPLADAAISLVVEEAARVAQWFAEQQHHPEAVHESPYLQGRAHAAEAIAAHILRLKENKP
jgi:hypothetical protein